MAYFDPLEVRDVLLKDILAEADILDSTAYINDLAIRFGVSPSNIPTPAPFQIKTLAMCYALMQTALNTSMNNGSGGESEADAYELKRRIYAKRVADLESQVTAQTFISGGSSSKKIPLSTPIRRC